MLICFEHCRASELGVLKTQTNTFNILTTIYVRVLLCFPFSHL